MAYSADADAKVDNTLIPLAQNNPLVVTKLPELVTLLANTDVNTPDPGVTLPIAVDWIPTAASVVNEAAPVCVLAPLTDNVVNTPEPGVTLPIAVACTLAAVAVFNVLVPATTKFGKVPNETFVPVRFVKIPVLPISVALTVALATVTLPINVVVPATVNAPTVVAPLALRVPTVALPDENTPPTAKLPVIVLTVPPTLMLPRIPTPPNACSIPVVVLVLTVVLVKIPYKLTLPPFQLPELDVKTSDPREKTIPPSTINPKTAPVLALIMPVALTLVT